MRGGKEDGFPEVTLRFSEKEGGEGRSVDEYYTFKQIIICSIYSCIII